MRRVSTRTWQSKGTARGWPGYSGRKEKEMERDSKRKQLLYLYAWESSERQIRRCALKKALDEENCHFCGGSEGLKTLDP